MKIGFCCKLQDLSQLRDIGARYVELSGAAIAALNEDEFLKLSKDIRQYNMKIVSVNCIMGSCTPLAQVNDFSDIERYLIQLFTRLHKMDIKIAVFGSGAFRRAPDTDKHLHEKKLLSFFNLLSAIADSFDVTIALEPLNSNECNCITTSQIAYEYVKRVSHKRFQLLIDLYHFTLAGESLDCIQQYVDCLRHVHIAAPITRTLPKATDKYDYVAFFDELKKFQYQGIVSVEAGDYTIKEVPIAYRFLTGFVQHQLNFVAPKIS